MLMIFGIECLTDVSIVNQTGGCSTFCLALWCPCVAFGQSMEPLSKEDCLFGGNCQSASCAWFLGAVVCAPSIICITCIGRTAIRKKYGIEGDDFSDCCASYWCHPCVLVQVIKTLNFCITFCMLFYSASRSASVCRISLFGRISSAATCRV
jgi:Cys-rich protein (TIGR01571 family)